MNSRFFRGLTAATGRKTLVVLAGVVTVALVTLMAVLAPVPAAAVVPGGNGPIAFTSFRDGNAEIYAMNVDGTNQTRLTTNSATDSQPAFSPDGTHIAFRSDRDNGNSDIYVMNADGTNQTRLTTNPGDDYDPAISPDGTRIAFASTRDNGDHEIYVMNADGTNPTRLTTNPGDGYEPEFSPDGTRIAFTSFRDGNAEIYAMNVDGTNQTRLTTNSATDSQPAFSPDGTRIAFISTRDNGNNDIYVMNADGTNQTRLTTDPAVDGEPDWGVQAAQRMVTTTALDVTPASPAAAGTAETLTATVTPSAAGSVQFQDGTTTIGNPVTVSNGTASITTTLSSGTHALTAVFTPNNPTAFSGSTSPTVTYVVDDLQPTLTTTTLTTSPAGPVDPDTSVTLNAAVAPAAVGSVQFKDGNTTIGSLATVINGAASMTTSALTVGSHHLTAVFTPTDPAFESSTSPAVTFMVNASTGAKGTTTTLRMFASRAFEGFPVIFLTNVAPRSAIGTIQLMDGATPLGTAVPVFGGFALTITTLPMGKHSLTAVFTPTNPAAFAPSTSSPVPLTVNPLVSRVPLR